MEFLLNRYRNLTVLLVVIVAQLLLLAYQIRTNRDVRLIRVWAVSAVTPAARVLEAVRSNTVGFFHDYLLLVDVREENRRLKQEYGQVKLENQFLKEELATAERVKALSAFQERTPSRTQPARIIASGTGANSKVVFVDAGSAKGVMRGMAVVTPDGIVGKIVAAYPTASAVQLITDTSFAAGVISQKNRVHGTLKGQGHSACIVDYVENEEKLEAGEWFFTSGEDRIFPKGMPVGQVKVVREGRAFKEIIVTPSGMQSGLEEVLIIVDGVHQPIPTDVPSAPGVYMLPPPSPEPVAETEIPTPGGAVATDADRLRERYKRVGEGQGHKFGEGLPGSRPPDFNARPQQPGAETGQSGASRPPGQAAPAAPAGEAAAPPANSEPGTPPAANPAPRQAQPPEAEPDPAAAPQTAPRRTPDQPPRNPSEANAPAPPGTVRNP